MKLWVKRAAILVAWGTTMVGAVGAGAYGHKNRAKIRAMISSVQADPSITTNLYTLRFEKLSIPAEGRDGGIAALGDGVLLASRSGKFWFVDAGKTLSPLPITVPVNLTEFLEDPFNQNTLFTDLFGVKDIEVQKTATGLRLLASHSHWHREQRCNTLRVSVLETTQESLLNGASVATPWRTVFETTPCRPLEDMGNGKQRVGLGLGGRVVAVPDGGVVLTVGGFDPENELKLMAPQKLDNSYGKTIWINPATGESKIFTIGHRNPQGLAVSSQGQLWLSEHAARGGDELNLLASQNNYGYPHVAYGTQYEMMEWPLSKAQGRHEGFVKPMYSWVPSIGISQLIVLKKNAYPHWMGDIIVSSLAAESLFRVRVEDNRTIFVEPIAIGHRIRDIIEANDGSIVLKTDDDFLVFLSPLNAATARTPVERGALLAAQCQACHSMTADGASSIGPALWGIVGKSVASTEGFTYSNALRSAGGRWTPQRLEKFLAKPNSFAPGTLMVTTTEYNDEQLADLVAYLQTLR